MRIICGFKIMENIKITQKRKNPWKSRISRAFISRIWINILYRSNIFITSLEMIHHHILSSLCYLFSSLDCLTVHTSHYFLSYVSQTRRNGNLSWTSDYVNDKLDLHSRKLMSRYMNDSRCALIERGSSSNETRQSC